MIPDWLPVKLMASPPSSRIAMESKAIEIRSPDEDWSDQVDRCRLYVDEWGCPLALLVDPESGTAEVLAFRPQQSPSVYRGHERVEPLYDGFGLELTPHAVWSEAHLES